MGANHRFDNLADYLRHGANVRCECLCGHSGVLDAAKLYRWFFCHRWPDAKEVLGCHLYCHVCRGRPISIRPAKAPPDRPDWMQYDHDWKRLIRRLRG